MSAISRPKIFISYASASRDRVGLLANALEADGLEVWWDHALNPGEDYRTKIEAGLRAAGAVIACWTPAATVSDWVISEADDARQAGKLIPVLLQTCAIPKPFDRLHTANLATWKGNRGDAAFQKLAEAARAKAEGREPKRSAWRRRLFTVGGIGAVGAAALAAALNVSVLRQLYDSFANPVATRGQVAATDAKVDEVLALLKAKSGEPFDPQSEAALRESIARLLSAQEGARGKAAEKLVAGDRDGALADLQASAKEAEKANTGLAETYKEIGALAFPDRTADAIAAYERAVALAPEEAEARNQLGHLYLRVGRLDEAKTAYRRILDAAGATDEGWQAAALLNLGLVAKARGDIDSAEDFYKRALVLSEKLGSLRGQAADLANLGIVAETRGNLAAAEDFHKRALALNEKVGSPEGQASALGNLGNVATARGDLPAAEDFYERALALYNKLGSLEGQAANLGNLGNVARSRGDLAGAEDFYKRALVLSERFGSLELQANQLGNLGLVANARGDLAAAEDMFKRALALDEKLGNLEGQALGLGNLGVLANARGDIKQAEKYWRRSLTLYRQIGVPKLVKQVSGWLRDIGADPDKVP